MTLQATVLKAVGTAERAIQDLKIAGQLVTRATNAFVPGSAPTQSTTLTPISIVITMFETKEVDGDRIRASDPLGLVFPTDSAKVPDTDDLVQIFAKGTQTVKSTYRVIYNDKVMAGDQVALSQLQLRLK